MISEEVRAEAKIFSNFWNGKLGRYPELKLDGTWPSIGIVDKILFPLRNKQVFNKSDVDLIKGAAAYIGVIAHKCWSSYKDTECQLTRVGENSVEYVLSAKGGAYLKNGQEYSIPLCRTIENIFKNQNNELPFFAQDKRFYNFEDNVLSSVCSGIVTGLSEYGQGAWSKLNLKQFEVNLISTAGVLARSCMNFYSERYGGELFGAEFDLYFPHLIIPPIKHNEPHLAARSTAALANYALNNKLSLAQIRMLTKNLSFSPDEQISTSGFLLACSVYQNQIPEWLLGIANSKGMNNSALRPSLILARKAYNISDPIDDLDNNNHQEAFNKITMENKMGFAPLLYLDNLEKWLKTLPENFFDFILWSSAEEACEVLENFGILDKLPADLALQLAYLNLNLGKTEEAEKTLQININNIDSLEKNLRFRYYEIKSIMASFKQENYIEHIEQAVLNGTKDNIRFSSLANQLARHYLQNERFEEAIILCEKINQICPWWISAQITKLMGLLAQKKHSEVEIILSELSPFFSISNHLFSFAKAFSLSR